MTLLFLALGPGGSGFAPTRLADDPSVNASGSEFALKEESILAEYFLNNAAVRLRRRVCGIMTSIGRYSK